MKHIRLFGLLGLLIGLTALVVRCAPSQKALDTEADFTGRITEIQPIGKEGTLGQVLIGADYVVTITDETLIFEQDGENRRRVTFEALEIGQEVQVWFSGPVLESYPAQARARQIVIVKSRR